MKITKVRASNRGWVIACWCYLAVLALISLSAYLKIIPTELSWIPFYDTVLHFILLGLAAFFSHLALKKCKIHIGNIYLPLAPVIVVICCIIDEIIQTLSPHRSPSMIDLIADLLGIVVFYLIAEKVNLKKPRSE